jgi:hypothetical protein
VQEITVDGDVVFSSGPEEPVALTNLMAWWPFDAAAIGGSNLDDASSFFPNAADTTNYDLRVDGTVTHQSSAGVTDITAGANSGAFDFSGSFPYLDADTRILTGMTSMCYMGWTKFDSTPANRTVVMGNPKYTTGQDNTNLEFRPDLSDWLAEFAVDGNFSFVRSGSLTPGEWYHHCFNWDGSTWEYFVTDETESTINSLATASRGGTYNAEFDWIIGNNNPGPQSSSSFDGKIDDVRIYDRDLTNSEIQQIFDNTKP